MMAQFEEGVEVIGKGGEGGEAEIFIELRTVFPGLSEVIRTFQAISVAYRKEHVTSSDIGLRLFLKHALIKKLEDYFFRKGIYGFAHVTRPLGFMEEGYIYEWAFGNDIFPWYYRDSKGDWVEVILDDWKAFISAFNNAGINLHMDSTDPEDGRVSQNIIHQYPYGANVSNPKLNRLWKRIDFGDRSIRIDYDKLRQYLEEHREDIRSNLAIGRYDLIVLACQFLSDRSKITSQELGRLEVLMREYRCSTLSHLNTRGVGSSVGQIEVDETSI
jgi:hypothetical protein